MSLYGITVELRDKASAAIAKFRKGIDATAPSIDNLGKKINQVKPPIVTLGMTIESLEKQLEDMKRKRLLTDTFDTRKIKEYNHAISALDNRLSRLKSGRMTGGMKQFRMEEMLGEIPGLSGLGRMAGMGGAGGAIAIGAGVAAVGAFGKASAEKSLDFEDAMAKINATALYDKEQLAQLKNTLLTIAAGSNVENATAQIANSFDLILGQLGDVTKSIEGARVANLLAETFKGTDMTQASAALSNSYSALGGKYSFQDIANTLAKAKNYGGGEFSDFSGYLPELFPLMTSAGYDMKEGAGIFSAITANGVKGDRAAMYMQNVLQALSKQDTGDQLEKMGINLFDKNNKRRGLLEVFGQLSERMTKMDDRQKEELFQTIELRDLQAKTGFGIILQNYEKMKRITDQVKSDQDILGETHAKTKTNADELRNALNELDKAMIGVGDSLTPVMTLLVKEASTILNGSSENDWAGVKYEQVGMPRPTARPLNEVVNPFGLNGLNEKWGGGESMPEKASRELKEITNSSVTAIEGRPNMEKGVLPQVANQGTNQQTVNVNVTVQGNASKEATDDMVRKLTVATRTINGRR